MIWQWYTSKPHRASNERYTMSEAIAIIQCKGYGEIMLGYQPTYGQQILEKLYTGKSKFVHRYEWLLHLN